MSTHVYEVISPEWGEKIPILDDGSGPTEYQCSWQLVRATSKREAISIGVKRWLAEPYKRYSRNYCQVQKDDGCNPFTGIKASIFACPHGVEWTLEDEPEEAWCDECRAEEAKHDLEDAS